MRRILKNAPAKSAIIFFSQLLRFFLTFRSAYATICSVANRIIICSNISALPKMLAKASMRNTNFKKYAGLFRRPPNVANRIRLRRAASNAHVFNKFHTQAYRSGHNEAVLKTSFVCLCNFLKSLDFVGFFAGSSALCEKRFSQFSRNFP